MERAQSVRYFRASVERDLEYLLNTRNPLFNISPDFVEVAGSVLAFGLPDFSAMSMSNGADQRRLAQMLERAIQTFETRLTGVNVQLIPAETGDRSLRFRIDAQLWLDPEVEPVTFDMFLQIDNHECDVREIG